MNEHKLIGGLQCTIANQAGNSSPIRSAVILFHGFGAPGTDLVPIAGELVRAKPELQQTVFIFPQAPIELDPHYDSRAWWMIDIERIQMLMATGEFRDLRNSCPAELSELSKQISEIVQRCQSEYGLASTDIFVGGFSQGAMLATDVALHHPDPLGGLIVWSGTLLNESVWKAAAESKPKMRVVQSHGRQDPILPFTGAELLRDLLVDAGHSIEFIPFDGEHTIGVEALMTTIKLLSPESG